MKRAALLVLVLLPACSNCPTASIRSLAYHGSGQVQQDSRPFDAQDLGMVIPLDANFALAAITTTVGVSEFLPASPGKDGPGFAALATPDAFFAAIGTQPVTALQGTELAVGQSFSVTGEAVLNRWDLPSENYTSPTERMQPTFTFFVDRYEKPSVPDDLDEDFETDPFATLSFVSTVSTSLGTFDVQGSVSYSVKKETVEECPPQPQDCGLLGIGC